MKLAAKVLAPPANEDAVCSLERLLPKGTPADYLSFLRRHDGAEFCFTDIDWRRDGFDSLRLFSVEEMLRTRKEDWLSKALPTLLVIGTDSGGQFLGYDMRGSSPWQLVVFTPGCADDLACTIVAESLSQALIRYEEKA